MTCSPASMAVAAPPPSPPPTSSPRARARALARISDSEAFRRPLGGYFHDRYPRPRLGSYGSSTSGSLAHDRLRVLFVSPYPICPPVHGGGVFMYQTLREMAKLAEVHIVELLDWPSQEADNQELRTFCASAEWLVRPRRPPHGLCPLEPHAGPQFAHCPLAL